MKPMVLSSTAIALAALTAGVVSASAESDPSRGIADDVLDYAPDERGGKRTAVSQRNDVLKDRGESAGLADPAGDEIYFEISVEAGTMVTCPGRLGPQESQNGSFVVLDLSATLSERTADLFPLGDDLFMPLVAQSFEILDADGGVVEGTRTEAAWLCFDEDELITPFIGPGERADGYVVLDSPVSHGSVIYDPTGDGGWVWPFGD